MATGFERHLFEPGGMVKANLGVAAAVGHATTVNGAGVDTAHIVQGIYALGLIDAGTDYRIDIQDSDDDAATDPYTDVITGAAQTAPGVVTERMFKAFDTGVTSGVSGFKRWVRAVLVVSSGTVDGAVAIVEAGRNRRD